MDADYAIERELGGGGMSCVSVPPRRRSARRRERGDGII